MALPTFSNSTKKTLHGHSVVKPNLDHCSYRLSSQVIKGCKKTTHHTGPLEPEPLLLLVHVLATTRWTDFSPPRLHHHLHQEPGSNRAKRLQSLWPAAKTFLLVGCCISSIFPQWRKADKHRVLQPFLISGVGLSIKGHARPYNICLQPWWEEPQPLRVFFHLWPTTLSTPSSLTVMMSGTHRPDPIQTITTISLGSKTVPGRNSFEKLVLWKSGLFIGRFLSHESEVEG